MKHVVGAGERRQLVEVAAAPDHDGGVVPDDEGDADVGRGTRGREEALERGGKRVPRGAHAREAPEQPRGARDVFEPVLPHQRRRDAEPLELARRRLVQRRPVQHHEIGPARRDRLDVRVQAIADVRHGPRRRRKVAPPGAADDALTGAKGEEQLRDGGREGDDAARGSGELDAAVRVVGDGQRTVARDARFSPAHRDGRQRDQPREVGAMYPAAHTKSRHQTSDIRHQRSFDV